jgi:hypothetical protein|tara:strand:- start:3094 stop:3519 length:426 start_codon:yes stop_codon:yes gene_type:complete
MSLFNKPQISELDPDDAFEDSDMMTWQGKPLFWSFRHWYLFLPMIKSGGEMCESEQITLALWIATHDEQQIKELRSKYRRNMDEVFADFEEAPEKLGVEPGSTALAEAGEIVTHLIESVTASQEQLEESDDDEEDTGSPGK